MLPGKQSLGWRLLGRTLTKERPWGHVEGGEQDWAEGGGELQRSLRGEF